MGILPLHFHHEVLWWPNLPLRALDAPNNDSASISGRAREDRKFVMDKREISWLQCAGFYFSMLGVKVRSSQVGKCCESLLEDWTNAVSFLPVNVGLGLYVRTKVGSVHLVQAIASEAGT